MSKDPDAVRDEDGIIWTEDIEALDYVREHVDMLTGTPRRPVAWRGPGRRVGYSVLRADAPRNGAPGRFTRRVFWVKEHDRSEQPDGVYKTGAPSEAVDPRTVAAGVFGSLTDRAWGAPLPAALADLSTDQPDNHGPAKGPKRSRRPPAEAAASRKHEATQQGVKEAFGDWLHLHDVSVPDNVKVAVSEAFTSWLWAHSEELVTAIAEAVAARTLPPEPPASNPEG
ncbi:DUF6009 family protein [Embleya sp. NPDC059259]|uniref:DUF6009 family protein n=1 Tax=unclassified Embleya TaxID=2699296 RepID=UPI00369DF9E1